MAVNRRVKSSESLLLEDNPQWYKDAVIYEVHVRAFCDGNGDGIGDFLGLTEKLDYLQDLGVTASGCLPFYPSPLRDDGYDIADYTASTRTTARCTISSLSPRGASAWNPGHHRVGYEPYFRSTPLVSARAARDPAAARATSTSGAITRTSIRKPDHLQRLRAVQLVLGPVAKAYFWHRFYSHQPDLNFDNPRSGRHLSAVLDFWLEMGVDGCGWTRCLICTSARGPTARTCRRPTAF